MNQVHQKAQIKACLLVIDSLITPLKQLLHVAGDNYANSLRVCFVRDASHKDLNLPSSFLKLMDDLLTEVIDVSVPQNADIVNKCVNILRNMAEFISVEKKKEENKGTKSPKKTHSSANEEQKEA
jgi:hypothetical protein